MNNKKTIKNILIGLGVAIALLVAYSFISSNEGPLNSQQIGLSSVLGDSGIGQIEETDTMLVNADILKILGSIENIELRDDIFTNPVFRKLKDTHFAIPRPARIGRPNPFLPIGFDAVISANQEETTQTENQVNNPFNDIDENEGTGNFFDGSVVEILNNNEQNS